ncbi:MAG: choice-of-anchor J domain-containing protein, partial [Mameliella sp.]|nr:choice-of-anchor J domain-containing protein [Phaeodactylibacter sp.]
MRAAILFIFALFLLQATETTAQVFFEQDFENGIEPMTLVDVDGQTPHPNVSDYPDAWNAVNPAFGNGTNVAISNSWYSPAGTADDWMITPAIEITNPNTIVSWTAKAQDANYPDGYEVRVSTTGNDVADFTDIIFSTPAEATEFINRSASLGDYTGSTIYIAWRNNSSDQFLLLVDDIKVEAIQALAVSATEFTTERYHEILDDINIVTTITNIGANTINTLD